MLRGKKPKAFGWFRGGILLNKNLQSHNLQRRRGCQAFLLEGIAVIDYNAIFLGTDLARERIDDLRDSSDYKELTDDKFVWNAMQKAKYDNWKNLDEQAYIEDDIAYLDPNQPMSANIKELTRLQQEMKTRTNIE